MNESLENVSCLDDRDSAALTLASDGRLNWSRWLHIVEWCLLPMLIVPLLWRGIIPGWRVLGSEFPNYYLAAELFHSGIPLDRVYEWNWFQRQNDHLNVRQGLVSFAPNPPSLILSLLPFTRLTPLSAKRTWIGLNLLLLAISVFLLRLVTSFELRRVLVLSLLCLIPLINDLKFARHYVLILFLICTAYYAACKGNHLISGLLWSIAAVMKLFPALVVVLFLWKRDWRGLLGFLIGTTALVLLSVTLFGVEVHRVFLFDVLTQASRGDWLGPYVLSQNSFITLWSHLFLIEPELNSSPWIDSPAAYASALAVSVTLLLFLFARSLRIPATREVDNLQWATLVPLLLLLSTTTAPDYSVLLIFSAVVGLNSMLAVGDRRLAFIFLLSYIAACVPLPERFAHWLPISRLVAMVALYIALLRSTGLRLNVVARPRGSIAALMAAALLTLYNLHGTRNRTEDFSRRLAADVQTYQLGNPVAVGEKVAFTEMRSTGYGVATVSSGVVREVLLPGNTLSLAGSSESGAPLYLELTATHSMIVRLFLDDLPASLPTLIEGEEPTLSPNGKWLAFIHEDQGRETVWRMATDSDDAPETVVTSSYHPLDITITNDGDVIAAAGSTSNPHLIIAKRRMREVRPFEGFGSPVRYPSISPDGKRLAFSRREGGSWHLFVRTLITGNERQLTHASCNAISPSWANTRGVLYATDCGRGVGLSTIARVDLPE
jgi:hypothetical protein